MGRTVYALCCNVARETSQRADGVWAIDASQRPEERDPGSAISITTHEYLDYIAVSCLPDLYPAQPRMRAGWGMHVPLRAH